MTEIEIYRKVLEQYGCVFYDEYSNYNTNVNYMAYNHRKYGAINVWFDIESEKVSSINFDLDVSLDTKITFNKDIKKSIEIELRNNTINQILDIYEK